MEGKVIFNKQRIAIRLTYAVCGKLNFANGFGFSLGYLNANEGERERERVRNVEQE